MKCDCVFPEQRIISPQTIKPHIKLYHRWYAMIDRCYNPARKDFKNYGARGIRISSEWMEDFQKFVSDTGYPEKGMTIDRENNDLGYCRHNFKWSTMTDQNLNRRDFKKKSNLPKYITKNGNRFIAQVRINKVLHHVASSHHLEEVIQKLSNFLLEKNRSR